MTIAQALAEGLKTTVVGLATVFAVLIILMLVLWIMKMVFYKNPAKKMEGASECKDSEDCPTCVSTEGVPAEDEDELIAVLTAAIAASLNTSTYNLQIKSYRRIDNRKPAWNRAGITETINSRF